MSQGSRACAWGLCTRLCLLLLCWVGQSEGHSLRCMVVRWTQLEDNRLSFAILNAVLKRSREHVTVRFPRLVACVKCDCVRSAPRDGPTPSPLCTAGAVRVWTRPWRKASFLTKTWTGIWSAKRCSWYLALPPHPHAAPAPCCKLCCFA